MRWLIVCCSLCLVAAEDSTINGWPVLVQSNPVAAVAVAPAIGGRIVSFRIFEHEFLFTDPALAGKTKAVDDPDPQFWGGGARTWLAPQERWRVDGSAWPPPPRLDYGPWTASQADGRILASSPIETDIRWNCAGMRIERSVSLSAAGARLEVVHTLINSSDRHQAWAPWSNVQVRATPGAAWAYFPVQSRGQYQPFGYMWYGPPSSAITQGRPHPGLDIAAVQYLHREGKLGADADRGWLCTVENGWAFARFWSIPPKVRFTENGNTVAIYTCGTHHLMEIEAMGPLTELPAGAQTAWRESWIAARVAPGPVHAVHAGGIVIEPLCHDHQRLVTGSFGIPDRGRVRLRREQQVLWEAPSDPGTPLRVAVVLADDGSGDLVLESIAEDGSMHLVDSCQVPPR